MDVLSYHRQVISVVLICCKEFWKCEICQYWHSPIFCRLQKKSCKSSTSAPFLMPNTRSMCQVLVIDNNKNDARGNCQHSGFHSITVVRMTIIDNVNVQVPRSWDFALCSSTTLVLRTRTPSRWLSCSSLWWLLLLLTLPELVFIFICASLWTRDSGLWHWDNEIDDDDKDDDDTNGVW